LVTFDAEREHDAPAVIDRCWTRVGVQGDGSCPELKVAVHCRNCPVFAAAGQQLFQREPPPEYVEERTQQLAQGETAAPGEHAAVVIFRLAEEWLALDVQALIEVAEPRVVQRVPHRSNRLLMGIVNIRGELLPCIALRELLGIEAGEPRSRQPSGAQSASHTPSSQAGVGRHAPAPDAAATSGTSFRETAGTAPSTERLLVTEYNQQRWALAVDGVAEIHRVATHTITPAPATVAKRRKHFSRGVFSWNGVRVGYLSESELFQSLEGSIG
jgi:chemotaxis-related protein WspD